MESLLQPFQFEFMRSAMLIAVLVAVPAALLSCFLVLKGWSLMGDAISHAVFPGVVIAYIVNIPYAIGAFVAGVFAAIAAGFLKDNSRIKQDTILGVVFSGMFGLGLVLYVEIQSDVHLDHILFGDMLGVGTGDIIQSLVIGVVVAAIILAKGRDFLLHSFDPAQARVAGLPVGLLHYGLLCMISLTVVSALTAVGILLAIAMLIAPGAIAFLVTRRFGAMLRAAVAIAVLASFLGVYLSFFLDSAPGPTIVLLMTAAFIVAFLRSSIAAARRERANAAAARATSGDP
ncbi:MAG: metal ABC transporter permease [Bauldia sp.]|nr:metal ABC transporter permease [Bauldia sp.]